MISDNHLSREAGRPKNFLAELKHRSPELYAWVKRHSIAEYENRVAIAERRMADLYYEIQENKTMSMCDFWSKHCKDLSASKNALITTIHSVAFRPRQNMAPIKALKRWETILERYEQYKENKNEKTG